MIILLNGPFGVGKTATARELRRTLPGAAMADPELAGYLLRRLLRPVRPVADYQDLRLWRAAAAWTAWLLRCRTRGALIVPVSVRRPAVYAELSARLRRVDRDMRCVRLTAAAPELRRRILSDQGDPGARAWRLAHLDEWLAVTGPALGVPLATDGRTPAQVARAIVALLSTAAVDHFPSAGSRSSHPVAED
jgi:hypothetical protein